MASTQGNRRWAALAVVAILMMLPAAMAASAQTFETLVNFYGINGTSPFFAFPVQGVDGSLYGTTNNGGASRSCEYGCGTVFKATAGGALNTLHSFDGTDGANPWASLLLGTDGNLYGTTTGGGGSDDDLVCGGVGGCGTVFRITPGGELTTLHRFHSTDGGTPDGPLVQGSDGAFYGTTSYGGANGDGTVFKITAAGVLTTLHSFDYNDGSNPLGGLLQADDGNFYGTTSGGANASCLPYGCGTLFEMTPGGALTTLHYFDGFDGSSPKGALARGLDGSFYGTTVGGGANGWGAIFKITSAGAFTLSYSFDITDGAYPEDPLILATDGNFYGTTVAGGVNDEGTLFRITPYGKLTTLHSFDGSDGSGPYAGLVQATSGTFYGTTYQGGTEEGGTVFSLSVGLGPFVTTLPTSRQVGQRVAILGTNLTGTSSVTFNGTPATFTVVSGTEIATTVPAGATSGTVQVVTPSGTLSSNVPFRVLP